MQRGTEWGGGGVDEKRRKSEKERRGGERGGAENKSKEERRAVCTIYCSAVQCSAPCLALSSPLSPPLLVLMAWGMGGMAWTWHRMHPTAVALFVYRMHCICFPYRCICYASPWPSMPSTAHGPSTMQRGALLGQKRPLSYSDIRTLCPSNLVTATVYTVMAPLPFSSPCLVDYRCLLSRSILHSSQPSFFICAIVRNRGYCIWDAFETREHICQS